MNIQNIKIFIFIFIIFLSNASNVYSESLLEEEINEDAAAEELDKKNLSSYGQELKILIEIKTKIINGNLSDAQQDLLKFKTRARMLNVVRYKYLAIIHFIKGEYESALNILRSSIFLSSVQYKKNCLIIVQSLMFLHRIEEAQKEFSICYRNTHQYSINDFLWVKSLISFISIEKKDSLIKDFDLNASTDEELKIWLKLGLYLNREEIIVSALEGVHDDFYKDKKIRELLGFMYYRLKDKKMAQNFLDGINSANRENILGNIVLEDKKFEIAYGYFQLALKKKINSLNAVERAVPLAWILKKWEEGQLLTKKLPKKIEKRVERLSLLTAFDVRRGNFKEAKENLIKLEGILNGSLPREINILFAYTSLMLDDYDRFRKYSEMACRQYDALACTNILSYLLWPDLNKMIKGGKTSYEDSEITMENIKKTPELDKLDEDVFINQQDIEELDNKLFQLKF
ncbi:MAG: hypothetical protein HQK51_13545 [Oligoflexia bacterium]|nr:hypothetical protein [Oligoflexia bacterium]